MVNTRKLPLERIIVPLQSLENTTSSKRTVDEESEGHEERGRCVERTLESYVLAAIDDEDNDSDLS